MAYPLPGRLIIGIFAFLTGVIISTVLWELLLKYYGDKTGRESARIGEPPQSVLREWTGDFPGRIKKVYRITGVLAVITAGLVAVFLKTGVAAALTIALCFYCIMYFLIANYFTSSNVIIYDYQLVIYAWYKYVVEISLTNHLECYRYLVLFYKNSLLLILI